jgi:microcompartment protein CcmL/EutN
MVQAIGLIETQGLVGLVGASDAMAKAANVKIVKTIQIGGSYVTVMVQGDIGSVRAAVDAGAEAVKTGGGHLVTAHVIANPHDAVVAGFIK